jgi:hypothetical protein
MKICVYWELLLIKIVLIFFCKVLDKKVLVMPLKLKLFIMIFKAIIKIRNIPKD